MKRKIATATLVGALFLSGTGLSLNASATNEAYVDTLESDGYYASPYVIDLWQSPTGNDANGRSSVGTKNTASHPDSYWFALTADNHSYNVAVCGGEFGWLLYPGSSIECDSGPITPNSSRGGVVDSDSTIAEHNPWINY